MSLSHRQPSRGRSRRRGRPASHHPATPAARPAPPSRRAGGARPGALRVAERGRTATGASTNGRRRRCSSAFACATWRHRRAARRAAAGGTRSFEVPGLDRARLARRRLPRRADRGRPPLGLHRAGRGADAVLRQRRRLCGRGHDGRHLGDRRLLRADRPERAPLGRRRHRRRARADAGRPDDHRGQCFIGARSEVVEGGIVREGSVLGMGVFLGQSTRSSTARPARSSTARSRPTPSSSPARCPASPPRGAPGPTSTAPSSSSASTSRPAPRPAINELLRD